MKNDGLLERMKQHYKDYGDNSSLMALVDIDTMHERVRQLRGFRELDKTQELIAVAIGRYRECVEKLTDLKTASEMSEFDRAYCFAAMDWSMYVLDTVGENPDTLLKQADEMVEGYAQKVGFIHK